MQPRTSVVKDTALRLLPGKSALEAHRV